MSGEVSGGAVAGEQGHLSDPKGQWEVGLAVEARNSWLDT